MNSDPFGHIASARHFQNVARQHGWAEWVVEIEQRIKRMEQDEMEYWQWVSTLSSNHYVVSGDPIDWSSNKCPSHHLEIKPLQNGEEE